MFYSRTVTRIDGYALAGCEKLTEVNIPANVETVGEYAVVGALSFVIRNVKSGTTVYGNPAKKVEF